MIKWDRPCYKCSSHFCDLSCEEPKHLQASQSKEQEQEPVACVQDLDEVKRKHLVYEKGMDWKDPLYTAPPQRTWVGLTDEEMYRYCPNWLSQSDFKAMMLHVEAKLKEKNT